MKKGRVCKKCNVRVPENVEIHNHYEPVCVGYAFTDNATEKDRRKDIETNPLQFLKKKLTGSKFDFGVSCITGTGTYREMGFVYDFRELLRKFVYKQYDRWEEIYALNKTNVRELVSGRISKIIELE